MSSFEQTRTCSECNQEETRQLEKIKAAFVQHSRWDSACGKCGSRDFSTLSYPMPNLDKEILEAWIKDENLSLLDQDEDIILASKENLELLKAYVVRDDAKMDKRSLLLSALCVLIYDCNEQDDAQTLEDTITFLTNNRHLFDEIGDDAVFDYVKDVAYPKIGLTPPNIKL